MLSSLNFEIGEFVTVRFPNRPVNHLIDHLNRFNSDNFNKIQLIKFLLEDNEFVFNIKTASPSLFHNLTNLEVKSKKQIDNILHSLIKYYKRFYSRPTPFSLFSSVALGTFENQEIELPKISKSDLIPQIRISEEWLNGFILKLENDFKILRSLELKTNDLIIEEDSTYYLAYYTSSDADEKTSIKEVNLKKTNLLEYTLNYFKSGNRVESFLSILSKQKIEEVDALNYLQNLLHKEYLISNLRISNSVEDKILELKKLLNSLGDAAKPYILFLDSITVTRLDDSFLEKEKVMKEFVEVKEYYQIDSFYSKKLALPYSLKKEFIKYSQIMYKIGALLDSRDKVMEYYLNKFMDNYGINVGVPIKTLINDKSELGPPPTYLNPSSVLDFEYYNSNSFQPPKKNNFINEFITLLLHEKIEEIDIQELLVNFEIDSTELKEGSADIYVSVYQDGDHYRIYPSGNIFSPFAGRTAGRFLYGLPEKEVKTFLSKQKEDLLSIDSNVELVNVTLSPFIPRASNVMKAPSSYQYEISISSFHNAAKELVDLEDIYVYTDGEKLKFYSKKLRKDLKFTISHMLNHQMNTPNIYRFMIDVELYNNFSTQSFNWGILDNKPSLPRIKCGDFIIQPKSWNLQIKDKKEAEEYVNQFIAKYNVPRFVKIVDYDNFVLIDLNFNYSKEILIKELASKKRLYIVEADELNYKSILKDNNNDLFINEIVFSVFVKKQLKNENQQQKTSKQLTLYESNLSTNRYPENWFYVKLYYQIGKDIKILTNNLLEFIQKIDGIGEVFYIKYADPRPHIRLRVKFFEGNKNIVQDNLHQLLNYLFEQRLIYDANYTRYKRELERYGGPEGITLAENVFIVDSLLVLHLLRLIEANKDIKYYILTIISTAMLNEFIEAGQLLNWIGENFNINKKYYKDYRKEIKENRKKDKVEQGLNSFLTSDIGVMWKKRLKEYKDFLNNFSMNEYYIASILHMHLNRLGIHNTEEEKMLNMIYYYLKEESYKALTTH